MKGYIEFITEDRIGFITNCFGRLLYINPGWPDDKYYKWTGGRKIVDSKIRGNCTKGRMFTEAELMLELL
jgi:hypothetical protein